MPFWKRSSNGEDKINYKARLERKQYLAQESPEPIYDLVECGLKSVPPGVYSRIKVRRKHSLLLQKNFLSNLGSGDLLSELSESLVVLDLHENRFEKLPEELGLLKHLQKLYLQHNRLKRLPDSIGELKRLDTLNVSHNSLKELPASLGDCSRLKSLEIQDNSKLLSLPKELCHARGIETLVLDEAVITYPSMEITSKGTEGILKYLSQECDIEYISAAEYTPPPLENGNGVTLIMVDPYDEGSLKRLEKQEEVKNEQIKALERVLHDTQEREKNIAENREVSRKKLIESMAEEEATRDAKIATLHSLKEQEKATLNKSLHDAETCTDFLINELVKTMNKDRINPQKYLEEMEAEAEETKELFTIKAGEADRLRQKDVLNAMQQVVEEEMKREELRSKYEAGKLSIISTALNIIWKPLYILIGGDKSMIHSENERAIQGALLSKGKHKEALVSNLLENEECQRNVFSAMYIQQDNRTQEICNRMEQVQSELASLTMIEMTKKDLKVEFEHDLMSEKRETLSQMLLTLMEQKEERTQILKDRLSEMEMRKENDMENYWLIQYQKLLDSKPRRLAEQKIDGELRKVLESAGAEDYIPILGANGVSLKQLSFMSDKELSEIGVHDSYLRKKIIISCEEYTSAKERMSGREEDGSGGSLGEASAPPDEETPSAPPESSIPTTIESFQSNECVVCLENKCNILFLPCGHVCSCWKCETTLRDCPLCRMAIKQKVRL